MCAEKIPTLSYMMPYFDEVLDVLEQKERSYRKERLSNEDADTLADGIGAAVQKIFKYFEVASDYAILATALDPRAKMNYYKDNLDSNYSAIITKLVEKLAAVLKLETFEVLLFDK